MVDIALKYIKINQIIQDDEQHKNYPKELILVGRKKKYTSTSDVCDMLVKDNRGDK